MPDGRPSSLLLAGACALLLAACADSAAPPASNSNYLGKDACFWTRNVYDWTVLDDTTLVVSAPSRSTQYLVKLFAPIPALAARVDLGFESKGGLVDRFCRDNGYVFTRGPLHDRQPVIAVQLLSQAEAAQLLAKARAARLAPNAPAGSDQAPVK